MKVQIKDLEPNPYRNIAHYPIDREKVEGLKNSIRETGFWDNMPARKVNGKYQIAYGHHRLLALREIMKPTDTIDIPIKDLDDARMIRMMAEENNDYYKTDVRVIKETVRAVWEYLQSSGVPCPRVRNKRRFYAFPNLPIPENIIGGSILANQISEWLGKNWGIVKVADALEWLRRAGEIEWPEPIDEPPLDKDSIEKMPHASAARHFADATKKFKLSPVQQQQAARKILDSQELSKSRIEDQVLDVKYSRKKEEKQTIKLEDYIQKISNSMESLCRQLEELETVSADFNSAIYRKTLERFQFNVWAKSLTKKLIDILEDKNVTTKKNERLIGPGK